MKEWDCGKDAGFVGVAHEKKNTRKGNVICGSRDHPVQATIVRLFGEEAESLSFFLFFGLRI